MKKCSFSIIMIFVLIFTLVLSLIISKPKVYALNDLDAYKNFLNLDNVTNKGKTYYVSPDATNGDGLTRENPCKITILDDEFFLKPGDTVILLGEKYQLSQRIYMTVSGTQNKYITIKSDTDTNVTLEFYNMKFDSLNRGVTINGNFIYWNGVNVCGAGDNGLYIGGSYNIVEHSEFFNNRDSGLQIGRPDGGASTIKLWPNYNYIRNCTSYNNYDNETYGENADGFAAKLTIGYGNIFDGCIAYRNSDDGWDLYAKTDSGNIGTVFIFNCVAFENGFLAENQETCNSLYPTFDSSLFGEKDSDGNSKSYSYTTRDGDGNGFKLGGSIMDGDTYIYNSLSFNNKMHGITDNSNPGTIYIENCTSIDNGAVIDDDKLSPTYGQVIKGKSDQEAGEECANIDVSRQTYSYNVVINSLSLKSSYSTSIGKDAARGSITDSIIGTSFGNTKAFKISGSIDADTKNGVTGSEINEIKPSDVLSKAPVEFDGTNYTYNISGLKNYSVDKNYRNNDHSINMHDIGKIKNYNLLFGDAKKIGCDLTKTSWKDYDHYEWTDYSNYEDEYDVLVELAKNCLFIPVNKNCCYQDFKVPVSMGFANISWESSDPSIMEIGSLNRKTASATQSQNIIVYRTSEIQTCTLTATIEFSGFTRTKTFVFTIMPDNPAVGNIYSNEIIDGRIIIDAYSKNSLPELVVTNLNDYAGKALSIDSYDLFKKVFYASDKNSPYYEVKEFTSSKPGVFKIVNYVSIKNDDLYKTYSYDVFVASTKANVDFANNSALINVTKDGFTLSGELSSATGKIYVYTSDIKLDSIDSLEILNSGTSNEFRNDSIKFSYEHENNSEYYVYYLLTNLNGEVTSEVYETKINVVEIKSVEDFNRIFGAETSPSSIYTLGADLDFKSKQSTTGALKKTFSGLFNGMGHTIKNVKITNSSDGAASLFYKVDGGTIENIKFDNFELSCGSNNKQVGIIATCYGGEFYNIQMTNIKASGKERVAALIGQVFEGTKTTISHVSLVNDDSHTIKAESKDAAGIIGLCQTTSNPLVDYEVEMDNILVIGSFSANTYCGGVIGRFDDQKPINYSFKIDKAYVSGTCKTMSNYCGGVMGGQVSSSFIYFSNIVSNVKLHHKGSSNPIEVSEKNCSPIMGRFGANASVTQCAGLIAEYNSNADLVFYNENTIRDLSKLSFINLGSDFVNTPNQAPYYTLKFIEINK